jgi:pimeloyl-[acyl-carrier protein] methyl ester esterase
MSALYTEVRGSGPTLVLLHGWGLNLRVFDGLAAALCDRFRIIAVDLPGHGRSAWLAERSSLEAQAAQVEETLASLAPTYSLLGWSLGGQIALQLGAGRRGGAAARTADRGALERLVLIAATPRVTAAPDWPQGTSAARLDEQAAGLRVDYRRTVSDFLELQVRGSAGGAAALAQLRAALFEHADTPTPSLAALTRGLQLLRETDLRPLLSRITRPALVIAGQYDRVTLPAASRALAQALPNARYVEIRRAAHAPFLSHLPELSALLADFLRPPP